AAIAQRELTVPEVAQSVILTRLGGGKTPMPPGEELRELARHGTTMAVFLSAARSGQLAAELQEGGYAEDTPVVVAYRATWPDELPELREPDLPRTAKVRGKALRTGWTTGTCASAAAKAATAMLATGHRQETVEVGLPSGERVSFPVERCELLAAVPAPRAVPSGEAVVVKDAGDDPDVTHGAHLTATVSWRTEPGIELDGGVGVGVVTKPGLGLELGGPAINPVPRAMITQAVGEAVDLSKNGVTVIIS